MQITLNTNEVSQVVLDYVQAQLGLDDSNTFVVELNEDGITVLVNEDSTDDQTKPQAEKPARQKRQPRKPKEIPSVDLAAQSAAMGNAAKSTQTPVAETPAVQAEDAGETTQEPSAPGNKEPSSEVATTVAVEEPAADPVGGEVPAENPETVEEPAAEEPVTPKPTTSLFANLRKPNNQ